MKYNNTEDGFTLEIAIPLPDKRFAVSWTIRRHMLSDSKNAPPDMIKASAFRYAKSAFANLLVKELEPALREAFNKEWNEMQTMMNPEPEPFEYERKPKHEAKMNGTRDEKLEWCKQRAFAYLDEGKISEAFASFTSDTQKVGLDYPAFLLGIGPLSQSGSVNAARKWIEGFN